MTTKSVLSVEKFSRAKGIVFDCFKNYTIIIMFCISRSMYGMHLIIWCVWSSVAWKRCLQGPERSRWVQSSPPTAYKVKYLEFCDLPLGVSNCITKYIKVLFRSTAACFILTTTLDSPWYRVTPDLVQFIFPLFPNNFF